MQSQWANDELNKKIEKFIRKMKEEIRIEDLKIKAA
jgi:hypothetical protein